MKNKYDFEAMMELEPSSHAEENETFAEEDKETPDEELKEISGQVAGLSKKYGMKPEEAVSRLEQYLKGQGEQPVEDADMMEADDLGDVGPDKEAKKGLIIAAMKKAGSKLPE